MKHVLITTLLLYSCKAKDGSLKDSGVHGNFQFNLRVDETGETLTINTGGDGKLEAVLDSRLEFKEESDKSLTPDNQGNIHLGEGLSIESLNFRIEAQNTSLPCPIEKKIVLNVKSNSHLDLNDCQPGTSKEDIFEAVQEMYDNAVRSAESKTGEKFSNLTVRLPTYQKVSGQIVTRYGSNSSQLSNAMTAIFKVAIYNQGKKFLEDSDELAFALGQVILSDQKVRESFSKTSLGREEILRLIQILASTDKVWSDERRIIERLSLTVSNGYIEAASASDFSENSITLAAEAASVLFWHMNLTTTAKRQLIDAIHRFEGREGEGLFKFGAYSWEKVHVATVEAATTGVVDKDRLVDQGIFPQPDGSLAHPIYGLILDYKDVITMETQVANDITTDRRFGFIASQLTSARWRQNVAFSENQRRDMIKVLDGWSVFWRNKVNRLKRELEKSKRLLGSILRLADDPYENLERIVQLYSDVAKIQRGVQGEIGQSYRNQAKVLGSAHAVINVGVRVIDKVVYAAGDNLGPAGKAIQASYVGLRTGLDAGQEEDPRISAAIGTVSAVLVALSKGPLHLRGEINLKSLNRSTIQQLGSGNPSLGKVASYLVFDMDDLRRQSTKIVKGVIEISQSLNENSKESEASFRKKFLELFEGVTGYEFADAETGSPAQQYIRGAAVYLSETLHRRFVKVN